jgi:hypothetical protein
MQRRTSTYLVSAWSSQSIHTATFSFSIKVYPHTMNASGVLRYFILTLVLRLVCSASPAPIKNKVADNESRLLRYLIIKGPSRGDSTLGIATVGKGKETKGSKSSSVKGKGNTFDHGDDDDDNCYCERRQRRLGVGYHPPCECPDGKGSKESTQSSKDSKSSSGKGTGKGGGYYGDDDDDDDGGPPSHYEPTGPTPPPASQPVEGPTRTPNQHNSSPTQPSIPTETPPTDSQPQPTNVPSALTTRPRPPTPTFEPSSSQREPSLPSNPTPTDGNQPTPSGLPNQPTTDSSPTDGSPTPEGGIPTINPPSSQGTSRCQLSSQGLFGSRVGLSEEFAFSYQTLVIPSVTVPELNIDMLPRLEQDMGNDILTEIFPQCNGDPIVTESLSEPMSSSSLQQTKGDDLPSARYGTGTYSNVNTGQRSLQDSGSDISGFSSAPRDVVNEGCKCVCLTLSLFGRNVYEHVPQFVMYRHFWLQTQKLFYYSRMYQRGTSVSMLCD